MTPSQLRVYVKSLEKQQEDLANSTIRNPPKNYEGFMLAVGKYAARDEILIALRESMKGTEEL